MVDTDLTAFWGYMQRRGRSPQTRVKYEAFLAPFAVWAAAHGGVSTITARQIELEYLGTWHAGFCERYGRPPAPKTIANHIAALRALYDFLERFDMAERNPARRLEVPKIEPRVNDWLRPIEDDALFAACRSPQECIVIPLLRLAGLRGGEAGSLLKRDVDMTAGKITVRISKTPRGRRVVPIVPELRPYLERWLAYQHAIGSDGPTTPFLATRTGRAMRHKQLWETVKRVSVRAGVRVASDRHGTEVSPHTLRRTFASSLINGGVRLEVVSRLLGHESTATTERAYASLLDEVIAAELLAAV
jgi:site-specific recombinase XerD